LSDPHDKIIKRKKGKEMAKTISVKIPTATLISEIEASIAQIHSDIANYDTLKAEYEVAKKEYEVLVNQKAYELLANTPFDEWGTDGYRSDRHKVSLRNYNQYVEINLLKGALQLPDEPNAPIRPNEKQHFGREYTTRLEILERNLKILKMSNQDEVNASTYSSLMGVL
jgi:hypothetical protein